MSRMRQSRLSGSAEGVMGNHDPYSDNTQPGLNLDTVRSCQEGFAD